MLKPIAVYRTLVACGAWASVSFVALGIVRAAVPAVDAFLGDPVVLSFGHVSFLALFALFLLILLVGFVGTLLHVATNPALHTPAQRMIIIAFLLLLTVFAPFVYYFAYLVWVRKARDAAAAA